ncbi:MAG: DNA polymerase III subunit delta' [Pseudomonadota bacterium]
MEQIYPWQEKLWQSWTSLRTRLPHALLLRGPQGIGKLDFALNIAQSLLCAQPLPNGFACDQCPSCHWFKQKTHPDFRLIQPDALAALEEVKDSAKKPAQQISVDQIRALSGFTHQSAHQDGYRVVLIHPAETMNGSAANALLKTLEEPSGRMLLILVSHKPQQLLLTIVSRCLALTAATPPREVSVAWLQQQGISAAVPILAQASFAPLQAARLAEDTARVGEHHNFLQAVMQPEKLDGFALAEQLQRIEPVHLIHWLQLWCHDLVSFKLTGQVRYHLEAIDSISRAAAKLNLFNMLRFQKELVLAKRQASHPLNPKLLFESLLLAYRHTMLGKAA